MNWIRTGGEGEDWNGDRWHCPDWYPVIRAARYLAAPPWKLVEKRTRRRVSRDWWLLWAMISETAELRAQAATQKAAAQKKAR